MENFTIFIQLFEIMQRSVLGTVLYSLTVISSLGNNGLITRKRRLSDTLKSTQQRPRLFRSLLEVSKKDPRAYMTVLVMYLMMTVTHFKLMFHFYTPRERKKTFSRSIEMEY